MEIFISIDGVLRNTIQKFDYHYKDAYLTEEFINESDFEYKVTEPIQNNNLFNSYSFQSMEEFEFFLFIEYPIEIFGHAKSSYSNVFFELNKLIHDNPDHNFTVIGLNEMGKAKPATLFFLSKNGYLGNNIKFIKDNEIQKSWEFCDLWITDNKSIVENVLIDKTVIKLNTDYNKFFTCDKEINKLNQIDTSWLKYTENIIT
jgi:hypothetical protein